MIVERSCGAVVFTKEGGKIQYVIIRSKEGFYGFPKGHVEGQESERETALREIEEETGLRAALLEGFRTEDSHPFTRGGETRMKHIVYFLAEYAGQTPVAQEEELSGVCLMEYERAMQAFQFESSRRILAQAHAFLQQRG